METRRNKKKLERGKAFDFKVEDVTFHDNESSHKKKKLEKENIPLNREEVDSPLLVRRSSRNKKVAEDGPVVPRKVLIVKRRVGRKKQSAENESAFILKPKNLIEDEVVDASGSCSVNNHISPLPPKNDSKRNTYELKTPLNNHERNNLDSTTLSPIVKGNKRRSNEIDDNVLLNAQKEKRSKNEGTFEVSKSESYLTQDISNGPVKSLKYSRKLIKPALRNKASGNSEVTFVLPVKGRKSSIHAKYNNMDVDEVASSPISDKDDNPNILPVGKRNTFELENTTNNMENLKDISLSVVNNIKKRGTYELERNDTNCDSGQIKGKKNSTFEVSSSDSFLLQNSELFNNSGNDKKDTKRKKNLLSTTLKKASRKSGVVFDLPDEHKETSLLTPLKKNENDQVGNANTSTIVGRRNTFELETTVNDVQNLQDMDISLSSSMLTSPVASKSEKRGTYEIERNDIDCSEDRIKQQKRSTFEIAPSDSFSQQTARKSKTTTENPKSNKKLLSSLLKKSTRESRSGKVEVTFKLPVKERSPRVLPKSAKKLLSSTPITKKRVIMQSLNDSGKSSSVKKVPNFAEIHKRALERQENLDVYVERKNERAKALLSGTKVKIGREEVSAGEKQSKKHLNFATIQVERGETSTKTNLTDSPKNAKVTNKSYAIEGAADSFVNTMRFKNNKATTSHLPVKVVKKQIPEVPVVKNSWKNPITVAKKLVDSGYTQFGFKFDKGAAKEAKKEQMKAIGSKTRVQKDILQEKRFQIKGVRTNKRFDLIMNMRLQNKK